MGINGFLVQVLATNRVFNPSQSNLLLRMEKICGSLLYELQIIWDEIGESDAERDRMLLELEQECLEIYRRKVDQANRCRAQLKQAIADAEAELAAICSAMGELPVHIRQSDPNPESLKDELRAILPQIEEMRKRRIDRKNQFIEVLDEIRNIENEIYRSDGFASNDPAIDEADLSIKSLKNCAENCRHSKRKVRAFYDYCSHWQLQDVATSLLELWNLMDTPIEEQQIFQKVTCKLAASEDEITEPDMLSVDYIDYVKAEVSRLEELKASKMKELVLKKKAELEVICRKTHLISDKDSAMETAIDAIESGAVDAACLLEQIELRIARVKEEALSRKEILEKVEKWMAACEEESWLEEYNRDDNRYNAGRGAHLALKRAEKARALVNKLPAMVDTLASKVLAWENEEGIEFTYDGVRLLSMLESYTVLRQQKEIERKRQRDQKKLQGQLLAEQEALYGSKPSPVKNQNVKKDSRLSCGGASKRKLSLGAPILQTPKRDMLPSAKATPNTRKAKTNVRINQDRLKDDGLSALSSGRRVSDKAGLPMKQQSPILVKAREPESPMLRRPFTPISTTNLSKPNASNISEDLNKKHNEMLHKAVIINNTPFTPPPKIISSADEENRTPQTTAITLPSTPSTVSVPMQTAITPAPLIQTAIIPALSVEDEIEYSFEERRADLCCLDHNQ
ncbi:hypothetical protein DH2020_044329 [Rehmannia glutinosa]|uniref:Microtubule-associated protein n=1 Tax=Rehmannia glutinosa TaxID=99300 RepID=A0ABR0UHJ4_REHGL